jgi:hypothetical protein
MRVLTTLALLPACFLSLVGCLSVTATQLGRPRSLADHTVIAAEQVAVYRDPEQVPGDYEEVALLHATGSLQWSSESEMMRKLREEAGRLGANAIILEPGRELSVHEKIAVQKSNVDIGREGRAVAIYVLPSEEPGAGPESEMDAPDSGAAEIDASYMVVMESGLVIAADTIQPSGVGQVKVTEPDGDVRYLSAAKIRSITDRNGEDVTARALDERRVLPRTTASL